MPSLMLPHILSPCLNDKDHPPPSTDILGAPAAHPHGLVPHEVTAATPAELNKTAMEGTGQGPTLSGDLAATDGAGEVAPLRASAPHTARSSAEPRRVRENPFSQPGKL